MSFPFFDVAAARASIIFKSQDEATRATGATKTPKNRNKQGNCSLVAPVAPPWDLENPPWWELLDVPAGANLAAWVELEERSAILEFEAGLTRQQAERRALIELETIQKGN